MLDLDGFKAINDTWGHQTGDTLLEALAARPTQVCVASRLAGEEFLAPSASAGIALSEPDSAWADLLRRADIALYHVKRRTGHALLHTLGMCQPPARSSRPGGERPTRTTMEVCHVEPA